MDGVTMILLYFVLCGQVYARDCNPLVVSHGNNATITFPVPKMDGETLLEINFLSYTTDQHLTNILIYNPMTDHKGNISITRRYFGRIERFEKVSGNFSFLLLNVTFTDSGNYTMVERTDVKGSACLLVSRQTFVARLWQPMKLILKTDEKNKSLIRIDNYRSKLSQTFVIYNVNNANCVYTDLSSMGKVSSQQCILSNGEFSFCIPEIGWLHKGFYFAWDDRSCLLDSFFLDVQDINTEAYVETRSGKQTELNLIGIVLGGLLCAGIFLLFVVWKLRVRRATYNFIHRSRNQVGPYLQGNTFSPSETGNSMTTYNLNDTRELERRRIQASVKCMDQTVCVRELGYSQSSSNTRCDLRKEYSVSCVGKFQSESSNGYDYAHTYDELSSDYQSNQTCIRPKLLDTDPNGSTSQSSYNKSCDVQHKYMTLRPPTPEHVAMKEEKQQSIASNHLHSNLKNLPKKSLSIEDVKQNNKGTMQSHSARSRNELDPNSGGVSLCLRVECVGNDYDHAYAIQRRHRRSWSNDALFRNRMTNSNLPFPRRSSASDMNEDYNDCLST